MPALSPYADIGVRRIEPVYETRRAPARDDEAQEQEQAGRSKGHGGAGTRHGLGRPARAIGNALRVAYRFGCPGVAGASVHEPPISWSDWPGGVEAVSDAPMAVERRPSAGPDVAASVPS